jgi:hypothetical protein
MRPQLVIGVCCLGFPKRARRGGAVQGESRWNAPRSTADLEALWCQPPRAYQPAQQPPTTLLGTAGRQPPESRVALWPPDSLVAAKASMKRPCAGVDSLGGPAQKQAVRNDYARATRYFELRCGRHELWYWARGVEGVCWTDASLIASREELVAILDRLPATRLPPFGAIVQLMAACRGKKIRITWLDPSKDERENLRAPCILESSGKRIRQRQRVWLFSTPEAISAAVVRLGGLPEELGDLLGYARSLPVLASVLLSAPGELTCPEGMVGFLGRGDLLEQELNHPAGHAKYPTVLEDLALLSSSLAVLPPGTLGFRLATALAADQLAAPVG